MRTNNPRHQSAAYYRLRDLLRDVRPTLSRYDLTTLATAALRCGFAMVEPSTGRVYLVTDDRKNP